MSAQFPLLDHSTPSAVLRRLHLPWSDETKQHGDVGVFIDQYACEIGTITEMTTAALMKKETKTRMKYVSTCQNGTVFSHPETAPVSL